MPLRCRRAIAELVKLVVCNFDRGIVVASVWEVLVRAWLFQNLFCLLRVVALICDDLQVQLWLYLLELYVAHKYTCWTCTNSISRLIVIRK